ncbi:hypothetical protein BKI52_15560 [marine bacterium AO1-C]|nr:hypothetical protein BKI52_15560 [marine bacterium AO1-C]
MEAIGVIKKFKVFQDMTSNNMGMDEKNSTIMKSVLAIFLPAKFGITYITLSKTTENRTKSCFKRLVLPNLDK